MRNLLAVGTASAVAPVAQQLSDEVVKSMSATSAKWVLAVVVALTVTVTIGGAVLMAGTGKPPVREPIKAPVPKGLAGEWREGKPIQFDDGGRVTSIAFSLSGKTVAVCRAGVKADGKINFFDPATRKHQQGMAVSANPKANPNRRVATFPAVAFRHTAHPSSVTYSR